MITQGRFGGWRGVIMQHKGMAALSALLLLGLAINLWPDRTIGWLFATPVVGDRMVEALAVASGDDHGRPSGWKTDWDKRTIELDELISGGPPRDGIPPIDHPRFVAIDAATWLDDREPVLVFSRGDVARAYPLQVLTWHEIVNDTVDGVPIAVTYCPLCNAAIVFSRQLDDRLLTFGTSGMLRNSDLVMWDRQTESLWQQLNGEGLVGELAGRQLTMLPSQMVSFGTFRERFPRGQVLSRETGHSRAYGENPYAGYDTSSQPFLYHAEIDSRLTAMDRVVAFMHGDGLAYAYTYLAAKGVVNAEVGGRQVVIFYRPGTASAMHARLIRKGRDVGAVGVFSREVGDRQLTFSVADDGGFTDESTGSTWSLTGVATAGALMGTELTPVLHFNHFWFAWQAFYPKTIAFVGGDHQQTELATGEASSDL